MKKYIYIIFLLTLIANDGYSQKQHTGFDYSVFPFFGLNFGRYVFAEAGVCVSAVTLDFNEPFSYNIYIANEFRLENNFILGPKLGGWVTYKYYTAGICIIDYTNLTLKSYVVRPDIGGEYRRFKASYGYNFRLDHQTFAIINSHQLNITYTLRKKIFFSMRLKKNVNFRSR